MNFSEKLNMFQFYIHEIFSQKVLFGNKNNNK